MDILEILSQVEDILYGTQEQTLDLCKILTSTYLEVPQPETTTNMALLALNYKHIQTLVDAIMKYEYETNQRLNALKDTLQELR